MWIYSTSRKWERVGEIKDKNLRLWNFCVGGFLPPGNLPRFASDNKIWIDKLPNTYLEVCFLILQLLVLQKTIKQRSSADNHLTNLGSNLMQVNVPSIGNSEMSLSKSFIASDYLKWLRESTTQAIYGTHLLTCLCYILGPYLSLSVFQMV